MITATSFVAASLTSLTLTGCNFALIGISSSTGTSILIGLGHNSQKSFTYNVLDLVPNEMDQQQECLPYAQSSSDTLRSWSEANPYQVLSYVVLVFGVCALILLSLFEFSNTFKKSLCLHLTALGLLLSSSIQGYISLFYIPRKEEVCGLNFMFEVLRNEMVASIGTLSITCDRGGRGIISEIAAISWTSALGMIPLYDWNYYSKKKQELRSQDRHEIDDDTLSIESDLPSLDETVSLSSSSSPSFPITIPSHFSLSFGEGHSASSTDLVDIVII